MTKICKECKLEMGIDLFYTHPLTKDWHMWRCIKCIKTWRKSPKEREMARVIDIKRNKNPKRIQYSIERNNVYKRNNPEKYKAHTMVHNFLRNNKEYKPLICSKCWDKWIIHYHHFDYSKPNHVIACCPLCHSGFHKWNEIDFTKVVILPF